MSKTWTREQQQAIDDRGNTLLVSAAAGAGKTAVLTARIVNFILEGKDISRMLIMTFTRAAAAEMRERIAKELSIHANENLTARNALNKLLSAHISTIDSFCADVVRTHFYAAEVDADFRNADEAEEALLQEKAITEVLENAYENPTPAFEFLAEWLFKRWSDSALGELLLDLYQHAQSRKDPWAWLSGCQHAYENQGDFMENFYVVARLNQMRREIEKAAAYFLEAERLCLLPDGPYMNADLLQSEVVYCRHLLTMDFASNAFGEGLTFDFQRAKPAKDVNEDIKKAVSELRDKGKAIIKSVKDDWARLQDNVADFATIQPVMGEIIQLLQKLDARLTELKAEKGVLSFSDVLHKALFVLQQPHVQQTYRDMFDFIFVDEYQDTNDAQDALIAAICRDNNVFYVGDVKQSIYRFRMANPALFMEKYNAYSKGQAKAKAIDLNRNFRSRKNILQCINFLFSHLMSEDMGEIAYDERAALYAGRGGDQGDAVELHVLKQKDTATPEEATDEARADMEKTEQEAIYIAKLIQQKMGDTIWDDKLQTQRPVRYQDIVVLSRAINPIVGTFSQVFKREGIPLYAEGEKGYLDAVEVKVFLSLLQMLDNQNQDIPLLAVLRSEMFLFTPDELLSVRAAYAQKGAFYEAFKAASLMENTLGEKIRRFYETIARYRVWALQMPLQDLVWQLLMKTEYYDLVGACPGGQQRQANLRLLVAKAAQFSETGSGGVHGFLAFYEKLKKKTKQDVGTAQIIGEQENVVRMMSVHKSKGLEFPIVVVAGLGRKLTARTEDVPVHDRLGVGLPFVDLEQRTMRDTLAQRVVRKQVASEELAEAVRVLYVAMTRAKEQLYLVGTAPKNLLKQAALPPQADFLQDMQTPLHWLCAICMRHASGEILREQIPYPVAIIKNDSRWKMILTPLAAHAHQESDEQEMAFKQWLKNPPTLISDDLKQALSFVYPFEEATRIPQKTTSHLAGLEDHPARMTGKAPAFKDEKTTYRAAEKGSLMHFVCQRVDLYGDTTQLGLKAQVDAMVQKELLPKDVHAALDYTKLETLFEGPLGQRMKRAKKIWRELPFSLAVKANEVFKGCAVDEPVLMQGVIDCCFEEDGKLVVVDYKTDRIPAGGVEVLVAKYKGQIDFYSVALFRIRGAHVKEKVLYLFEANERFHIA